MKCEVYKVVRIKNWILRKNNLTGCNSDISNGYATCEQKWQTVIRETEKAVLVHTVKGDFWFPKSTVVEEEVRVNYPYNSLCRVLSDELAHAEWMLEELGRPLLETFAIRNRLIEKHIREHSA